MPLFIRITVAAIQSRLAFTRTRYIFGMMVRCLQIWIQLTSCLWDVNKVKAEYSYKDKCFLNVQIEKYGSNHLNDVLYTVYLLNISELLPEILTSISSCFTKAIRNSKEQFAKEIIDSQVIVDMIILKSFIFYSDEIKKDEKLINAYEDILLALTEIRNEKAAVLLDEFRIH